MKLFQVKDYVREHFGRVGIATGFLDLALEMGRKEIENAANFWWMEDFVDFNLIATTSAYPVKTTPISEANFKDLRAVMWKKSTETQYESIPVGHKSKDELDLEYQTDDEGEPEQMVLLNETLYVYPIPDDSATYNIRLYFYQYTDYPAQTEADDLILGFPMAVIYSTLAQANEMEAKDLQAASYWRKLLGGEIPKLKREHLKRSWMDKINFEPRTGPFSTRRSMDNMQLYPKR